MSEIILTITIDGKSSDIELDHEALELAKEDFDVSSYEDVIREFFHRLQFRHELEETVGKSGGQRNFKSYE